MNLPHPRSQGCYGLLGLAENPPHFFPFCSSLLRWSCFFFFFFLINLFFWLHWVFVAARAFSSCGERGLLFIAVRRLLIAVASLVAGTALGSRALEHRLSSCGGTGLVAPRHVGSSQTRARTRVLCLGRRILNHCATRETP